MLQHHIGIDVRKSEFLHDPESTRWAAEVHKIADAFGRPWGSIILFGNEDAPEAAVCYLDDDPLVTDAAQAVFVPDREGRLTRVVPTPVLLPRLTR